MTTRYQVTNDNQPNISIWQGYADTGVDAVYEALAENPQMNREDLSVDVLN